MISCNVRRKQRQRGLAWPAGSPDYDTCLRLGNRKKMINGEKKKQVLFFFPSEESLQHSSVTHKREESTAIKKNPRSGCVCQHGELPRHCVKYKSRAADNP